MKRRYLIPTLALLGTVWVVALAAMAKNAVDRLEIRPWGNPIADSVSVPLGGNTRVGQSFTAPMPGLYRIELGLVPAVGDAAQTVIFHLEASPTAPKDLYTTEFSTAQVDGEVPFGFEFEPIRDSKDREFFFYLEAPATTPEEAPSVRYSPNATLEKATAYVDGKPVAGDVAFHTLYTLRTRDKVHLLLSRMTEDQPYLLGSKAFYSVLAVAYVSALGAFLYKVGYSLVEGGDEGS